MQQTLHNNYTCGSPSYTMPHASTYTKGRGKSLCSATNLRTHPPDLDHIGRLLFRRAGATFTPGKTGRRWHPLRQDRHSFCTCLAIFSLAEGRPENKKTWLGWDVTLQICQGCQHHGLCLDLPRMPLLAWSEVKEMLNPRNGNGCLFLI